MTDLPTKFSSFSTWETSVTPLFNVYIKHGYCPEARLRDEDVSVEKVLLGSIINHTRTSTLIPVISVFLLTSYFSRKIIGKLLEDISPRKRLLNETEYQFVLTEIKKSYL